MRETHPRVKLLSKEAVGMRRQLFRSLYPFWSRLALTRSLKRRRFNLVNELLSGAIDRAIRVLEIGCANGEDFLRFLDGRAVSVYGIDLEQFDIRQENVTFIQADAEYLDFDDGYFDVTVSFGVLEHVEPLEKLCRMAKEIARVSKAYCMVVPSIGTILEPHTMQFRWQVTDRNRKQAIPCLNYLSDEAWLQLEGFRGASTRRFWYVPGLLQGLAIYRSER